MKKIIFLGFLLAGSLFIAQKNYIKLNKAEISKERVELAEKLAEEYLDKCRNSSYVPMQNYIFDKRIEKKVNQFETNCTAIKELLDAKIKIAQLNSVYIHKDTKNSDPADLIIFDATFEDPKLHKFISVWIYHDKNVIGGLYFSEKKPLKRKK